MQDLRYHEVQSKLWSSYARFRVVWAGRRSGKTELAKRFVILQATTSRKKINGKYYNERYFVAAPTRDQAKRIYWEDLKTYANESGMVAKIMETDLVIYFINGNSIWVCGLDKPARIEGQPWDGGILDEIDDMKEGVWELHVRPALSDRQGWCWFVGVPEGKKALYDFSLYAPTDDEWEAFTWFSSDILPPKEIESAKRQLDPEIYRQEYEAAFISFSGMVYHPFNSKIHCRPLEYNIKEDLGLCFDFNVEPGVCAIMQEFKIPVHNKNGDIIDFRVVDGVIDEVIIPMNSNTERITKVVAQRYGKHKGDVYLYGDASGSARHTSQVSDRSDWAIIEQILKPKFPGRLYSSVPKANPEVRNRINSVNARLMNTLGDVHLYVDPKKCPTVVRDFESVVLIKGTNEIDKKSNKKISHISDSIGYAIYATHPVKRGVGGPVDFTGF